MKLTGVNAKTAQLIVSGKTNEEIAQIMNYSIGTVKRNIKICYKLLKAKNRADFVRKYLKSGLKKVEPFGSQ